MKYALLIYEDEAAYGSKDKGLMTAAHMAFGREAGTAITGGAGLKGSAVATTIRAANGARTVHDGPFAETKEQLGGFYLVDAPDLDAAIEIAKKVPLVEGRGAVEIRPLLGG